MKRIAILIPLIAVLAALAPGIASASQSSPVCTADGGEFSFVTGNSVLNSPVSLYLGAPNRIFRSSAAELKPRTNATTLWVHCNGTSALNDPTVEFTQTRGTAPFQTTYALTSRDASPGGNVGLETANNYASQEWIWASVGGGFTFLNAKTGLYLRVRNNGPFMYQTVTTGFGPKIWSQS